MKKFILIILNVLLINCIFCKNVTIEYTGNGEKSSNIEVLFEDEYFEIKGSCEYKFLWLQKFEDETPIADIFYTNEKEFHYKYPFRDFGNFRFRLWANNDGVSQYVGIGTFVIQPERMLDYSDKIAEQICDFVNDHLDEKVGNGECWDLLNQALIATRAEWENPDKFGKLIYPDRSPLQSGDMIHFQKAVFKGDGKILYLGLPNHYAIIMEVNSDGTYNIAHQNIGGVKKVIVEKLNPDHLNSGIITYYRPVSGLIAED